MFFVNLMAETFRDDLFKLNMTFNELEWQKVDPLTHKNRLTLRHITSPATLNVIAYRFQETITANGLVQKRIQSVYDGWQVLNQSDLTNFQSRKKNVSQGIRSIYKKTYLDAALSEQHMIAGDVCFVADDSLGIILNISVLDSDTLLEIKTDFNKMYESFWFGDNKPTLNSVVNNNQEWIMDTQNLSRMRYFASDFNGKDAFNITRKVDIIDGLNSNSFKSYTNHNGDYFLNGSYIHFVHPATHQTRVLEVQYQRPELILTADGFYVIQKSPSTKISKYSNDFELMFEYNSKQYSTEVVLINDNLLVIESKDIKLINQKQSLWELPHNYEVHGIAADNDVLIIADNNGLKLHFIDLNNGQLIESVEITKQSNQDKFRDFLINQSKVLVVSGELPTITIVDLNSKQIEDSASKSYLNFHLAAVTPELILVQYKDNDGQAFLEALDFNTFASVWVVPFNNQHHPVVSSHYLFSVNHHAQIESVNLKSAKKKPPIDLQGLLNPGVPSTDTSLNVLGLMPAKNELMAVVKVANDYKILYLR
jgi:hypothetical protein